MVQPAESLLSKNPTRSWRANPAVRCPLLKSEMSPVLNWEPQEIAEV